MRAPDRAGLRRAPARDPADVTLVVVTKTFPAVGRRPRWPTSACATSARTATRRRPRRCGTTDGAARPDGSPPRWHFVGQLQRNKAASVARYADVVHSVDRLALVRALGSGAAPGRPSPGGRCCRSASTTRGDGQRPRRRRAGRAARRWPTGVAGTEGLVLRGVMAVAPLGEPPGPAFDRLAALAERLRDGAPAARPGSRPG